MSILEYGHHKLLIAHGLTLVIVSLHGWEVFPMPRALTHTRITWALSPMGPEIWVSLWGPPCAHGVAGTPHGEVHYKNSRIYSTQGDSYVISLLKNPPSPTYFVYTTFPFHPSKPTSNPTFIFRKQPPLQNYKKNIVGEVDYHNRKLRGKA